MKSRGEKAEYLAELIYRHELALQRKEQIISHLQNLTHRLQEREISYDDYLAQTTRKLNGRTLGEWISYYDEYIAECKQRIENYNKTARREKLRARTFVTLFVALALGAMFLFGPVFTGFIVNEFRNLSGTLTDDVNLVFNESGAYTWNVPEKGELEAFKISGTFRGKGNVKVYLDDKLVFDNAKIKSNLASDEEQSSKANRPSLITGRAIDEANYAGDASAPDSVAESSEPESASEEKEPIRESSENSATEQTAPGSASSGTGSESELEENTTVEPGENQSETITGQERVRENDTIYEKVIEFSEECVETCDLSSFNLNASSYTIRVEIENAEINIKTIHYSVKKQVITPIINETLFNESGISVERIQGLAILGQPVVWTDIINASGPAFIEFELPDNAENVTIEKESEESEETSPDDETRVIKIDRERKIRLENQAMSAEKDNKNKISVQLGRGERGAKVHYTTPAALSSEEYDGATKIVHVTGEDDVHYENVTLFTELNDSLQVKNPANVHVFWVENESYLSVGKIEDRNNDSSFDYIEWIAPRLSNQTYRIIIITNAEHLDENRVFVSDIYEEVRVLDNIWSETIPNTHYVRATFRQNLTSSNDITVYPRITSGNPKIEVYENNGTEKIAEFSSLVGNEYNKVYLTNLQGEQDTFDLKILDGGVEFDHILDPPTGRVTLYLNNTASGGSCPTTSSSMGTGAPASLVTMSPGEFDSTLPGNTDAGRWRPGVAPIANTTASAELMNTSDTTVFDGGSLGTGWIWKDNLTGYTIAAGNYTFNVSVMGGQGTTSQSERLSARISVVSCSGSGEFTLVKNMTTTKITGEGSHVLGQTSWRDHDDGARFTHVGAAAIGSRQVNITASQTHDFIEGEFLFIELGFGDGDSTTDRTLILRYNNGLSFVITPAITQTPVVDSTPPVANLNAPLNGSNATSKTNTFNATFTDNSALKNATLYIYNATQTLINSTENRSITNAVNTTNITIILPYDGTFFWNYLACDSSSNCAFNATNLTLTVDTTPPLITIINPQNTTLSPPIIFNVTLNEAGNRCNYTLNAGVTNYSMQGMTTTNFNATNTSIADGSYVVRYACWDAYNNLNNSVTRAFGIDTAPPQVTILDPANTTFAVSTIFFNVSTNENSTTNYTLNGGVTNYSMQANSTGTGFNATNVSIADGSYLVRYLVWDIAGNFNGTMNRSFSVSTVAPNTAPNITFVSNFTNPDPIEDTYANVSINFTAFDLNGATDLNDTSATMNFTFGAGGEALRQNATCMKQGSAFGTNYQNYTCVIQMWYFDASGTWNITAFIKDVSNVTALNKTTNFLYNQLSAFTLGPAALTWASLLPGQFNQSASNFLTLNNTGNKNITSGNVQINATNLRGETDSSKAIWAGNMSVAILTGSSIECNENTNQTAAFSPGIFTNATNATLMVGNHSVNNVGNRNLYLCIRTIGSELSSQSYSTSNEGSWTIKILVAALTFRMRRRKKKKIKEDNVFRALSLLVEELREKHTMSGAETLSLLVHELKEKHGVTDKEIAELIETRQTIPLEIFSTELGFLEALCKYLKENKQMSYHEIAEELERDDRTVWTAYKKACEKQKDMFVIKNEISVPLSSLRNKDRTVLESLVVYLKDTKGMRYSDMADMLGRDQRNMWASYARVKKREVKKF